MRVFRAVPIASRVAPMGSDQQMVASLPAKQFGAPPNSLSSLPAVEAPVKQPSSFDRASVSLGAVAPTIPLFVDIVSTYLRLSVAYSCGGLGFQGLRLGLFCCVGNGLYAA